MPGLPKTFAEIRAALAARGIIQNKDTDAHWQNYEREFPALRNRVNCILEIGIYQGASLAALAEYFPGARVHGWDIIDFQTPEFRAYLAEKAGRVTADFAAGVPDAPTPEFLARVAGFGQFDLIIDDGAHTFATSRTAYDALFRDHVSPGGLYIIEDWGTTYWPTWSDGSEDGRKGMLNLMPHLCDLMTKPPNAGRSPIARVELYHWQIWIWKKPA